MSPDVEPEKPDDVEAAPAAEDVEVTPAAEATRSGEVEASADVEDARVASAADATPTAAADGEPDDAEPDDPEPDDDEPEGDADDAEADDEEPEAEVDAPAAKRRRRPGRRRAAEPEAEKPAKPTPSRRRARRDPNLPAPVVRAQAKYVRSSARKARLVCDHIRGKSVEEARAILALTPRAIAKDWSKLLESAVANAEHNHELVGEDLYVKAVHADEGPTIKRFRPRAMGRATRIRKRTSHLTILLTPKD
jgi:ribosomal protein L22